MAYSGTEVNHPTSTMSKSDARCTPANNSGHLSCGLKLAAAKYRVLQSKRNDDFEDLATDRAQLCPVGVNNGGYGRFDAHTSLSDLLLAVSVTAIVAIFLGVLLTRSIADPVSRLREAAARFGTGNLSARSRVRSRDEIGELGQEFDAMADRLSITLSQRTTERNQMAAVLAYMHDGIAITDEHGRIKSINSAASRLFDIAPEKAYARSLIEVTRNYELHKALRDALVTPTRRQRVEFENGKYLISAVITAVPSFDDDQAGPNGLVVLQDVTELRRLERVRRDFVANIGHELRTPLASIKLLVETLDTTLDDDPEASRDFLRRIDIEIDGLTQLVRELLELSRIESGQVRLEKRPVQIPDLLERAAARLRAQAERAGLTLSVEAEHDLPTADADPARLEQVLVNLLHNAIKFTPPGGQVTLRADEHDNGLVVSVVDTGIGIPKEDLPRIFERFYKVDKARTGKRSRDNREGGTGLGLAIAKHIVQAHGGQIWAESVPDNGAAFYFTLPVSPVSPPSSPSSISPVPAVPGVPGSTDR